MKVVALDLSLSATGVAETIAGTTPFYRTLRTPKLRGVERLRWVRSEVLLHVTDADLVVLEGYAFGRPNQAHYIGELGGVIKCALDDAGVEWIALPPAVVKKIATGKGNASKDLVLVEAVKRLGYAGADNNQADALWLLQAALHAYDLPGAVSLPKSHLAALEKIQWPAMTTEAA